MLHTPDANHGTREQGTAHGVDRQGMSAKRYPKDCPPLKCRWFYAVDSPKRKPNLLREARKDSKPLPLPKKYVPFSSSDSRSIESAYQEVIEDDEGKRESTQPQDGLYTNDSVKARELQNTSISEAGRIKDSGGRVKVPVNEDYLFDVDVEERELAPVYWLGPIYEVRRGSWFYQEGTTLRPCEESLAIQLEEGYLKVKPYQQSSRTGQHAAQQSASNAAPDAKRPSSPTSPQHQTHRLLGPHMNSIVTYQDDTIARLSYDSIMSRVSSTMYEKFAGGGHLSGVKLVRGYPDTPQDAGVMVQTLAKTTVTATTSSSSLAPQLARSGSGLPVVDSTLLASEAPLDGGMERPRSRPELPNHSVPGYMPPALDTHTNAETREEAARKRDEMEIQDDYPDRDNEIQSRPIDHLILVTHGIGQRLGMRTESINFVHDVNVLRQTLKNVYADSPELQAFNKEVEGLPKNCRIQVLPVCWRHLLDFPRRGRQHNRGQDDADHTTAADDDYPRLEDITLEGVPFIRSLITDLALDILLYQSAYREHICRIVLHECNRIYQLFVDRNPQFTGKVSLVGHSLGSLIFYDLCCRQLDDGPDAMVRASTKSRVSRHQPESAKAAPEALHFVFDVEDLYCLGSPIGLFQMLKGRTIAARGPRDVPQSRTSTTRTSVPTGGAACPASEASFEHHTTFDESQAAGLLSSVSSPKCARLFNVFHPSDPISYRLEPLIDPMMSSVKPQALPYTKKGMFSASASQGFTGIGSRVGQSVTGLWSSISSSITSSLLSRTVASSADRDGLPISDQPCSGTGSPIVDATAANQSVPSDPSNGKKRRAEDSAVAYSDSGIDSISRISDNTETLFQRFERVRPRSTTDLHDAPEQFQSTAGEAHRRGQSHDWKIRALNSSGRVDYALQESVLDFNPINTIASHLSYWSDEDVGHFVMSQLLCKTGQQEARRS